MWRVMDRASSSSVIGSIVVISWTMLVICCSRRNGRSWRASVERVEVICSGRLERMIRVRRSFCRLKVANSAGSVAAVVDALRWLVVVEREIGCENFESSFPEGEVV